MENNLHYLSDPSIYPQISHEPDERLLKLVGDIERQMQLMTSHGTQRQWLMTVLAAATVAAVSGLVLRWFWVDVAVCTAWTGLMMWNVVGGLDFRRHQAAFDAWVDRFEQLYPQDSPMRHQALQTLWELAPPSLAAYVLHDRVAPVRRVRQAKPVPAPQWVSDGETS